MLENEARIDGAAAIAQRDAGNVRTVAMIIVGFGLNHAVRIANEIGKAGDAAYTRFLELLVRCMYARVDDADVDPCTAT